MAMTAACLRRAEEPPQKPPSSHAPDLSAVLLSSSWIEFIAVGQCG
jgi:hypothetical protein